MQKLPEKFSGLLEMAYWDSMSLVEKDGYHPWSSTWLEKRGDTDCMYCFAGAVMAGTLKDSPLDKEEIVVANERFPWQYPKAWQFALYALEDFRAGNYSIAWIDWLRAKRVEELVSEGMSDREAADIAQDECNLGSVERAGGFPKWADADDTDSGSFYDNEELRHFLSVIVIPMLEEIQDQGY